MKINYVESSRDIYLKRFNFSSFGYIYVWVNFNLSLDKNDNF